MDFLNALKEVSLVSSWIWHKILFLPWYAVGLIVIIALLPVYFFFIAPLWHGYNKPLMLQDKKVKVTFFHTDLEFTVRGISIIFVLWFVSLGLIVHFLFWLPFFKIALLSFIVVTIAFFAFLVYDFGYTLLPLILFVTAATQILALCNINFGLPDIPAHYIFDWWGHGMNSASSLSHWIPLPSFTMNPSKYEINVNQYFYIIVLFFGYFGIFQSVSNIIKWTLFAKYNPQKPGKTYTQLLMGEEEKNEPEVWKKLSDDLKLVGFKDKTIELIQLAHSPLIISELIEKVRDSNEIKDKKQYIIDQLEGVK
jgi:hypothetical protein